MSTDDLVSTKFANFFIFLFLAEIKFANINSKECISFIP